MKHLLITIVLAVFHSISFSQERVKYGNSFHDVQEELTIPEGYAAEVVEMAYWAKFTTADSYVIHTGYCPQKNTCVYIKDGERSLHFSLPMLFGSGETIHINCPKGAYLIVEFRKI